ncbi:MAG: GNAT family N-acetyltransferase [Proteocatella sp.]
MKFRKSVESDAERILEILGMGRNYLKLQGIDQWQDEYPNLDTIYADIKEGVGYVGTIDDTVSGYLAIVFDIDVNYNKIYNGAWLSDKPYGVVHRVAIDDNYRGQNIAYKMMDFAQMLALEKGIEIMKIDTHRDNTVMQKLISKMKYNYCGIIYVSDGTQRLAYEKSLK